MGHGTEYLNRIVRRPGAPRVCQVPIGLSLGPLPPPAPWEMVQFQATRK